MLSISKVDGAILFGDSTVLFAEAHIVNRYKAPLFRLGKEKNGGLDKKSLRISPQKVEKGDDVAIGVIAIFKIGEEI